MENTGKTNPLNLKIQGLIDRYLRLYSAKNSSEKQLAHLNEDSLTAFVEGNLGERELKPMVSHLIDCSFCRHVTAELIKLDAAFAEESLSDNEFKTEPTKISDVLNGIFSKIFGNTEGVVFAHQENEQAEEEKEEKEEKQ